MPGIFNLLFRDVMKRSAVSVCVRDSLPPAASNWNRVEEVLEVIPCGIVRREVQGTAWCKYNLDTAQGKAGDERVIREG